MRPHRPDIRVTFILDGVERVFLYVLPSPLPPKLTRPQWEKLEAYYVQETQALCAVKDWTPDTGVFTVERIEPRAVAPRQVH